MPIRTIIVDDEPLARDRIRFMLSNLDSVALVGECETGVEAVEMISNEKPDLVFLDIMLPDLDGFEILSELTGEDIQLPLVVFQTAFNEHAIRAFEVNAIDYLLKPFRRERLEQAVVKAMTTLQAGALDESRSQLNHWMQEERDRRSENASDYFHKIEIRDRKTISYVPVEEVLFFQADRNYIEVHTPDKVHLWRQAIGKLESKLDPESFLRISRSVIIPIGQVTEIETPSKGEHWVILQSGERLSLSRNLLELRDKLRSS